MVSFNLLLVNWNGAIELNLVDSKGKVEGKRLDEFPKISSKSAWTYMNREFASKPGRPKFIVLPLTHTSYITLGKSL